MHETYGDGATDGLLGRQLSHYRIIERVGAGGMGVVYRAHDERLDREVALKVLAAGMLEKDGARSRLEREAIALARLNHPNIGTVFNFDEQDGVCFLVMELVDGISLESALADGLSSAQVIDFGIQLARGLGAAHAAGIVHRDLKPSNILIAPGSRLKILDFGLAKLLEAPEGSGVDAPLTATGGLVGTLPYMAPEQILGRAVDARTDIFSAGVILYEMATGRRPFPARLEGGAVDAILQSSPDSPRSVNREISRPLEHVILRALEKDPARRYQSAAELCDDLCRLSGTLPGAPSATLRRRRRRAIRAGLVSLAAVAVLLGLYLFFGRAAATSIGSIAVLPFENATGNPKQDYVADGLTEGLILSISRLQRIKVIARASVFRYKGKRVDPRSVGEALGVRAVLTGRLFEHDSRFGVSVELIDAHDRRLIWGARHLARSEDLLGLQHQLAQAIARQLRPHDRRPLPRRMGARRPRDARAVQYYLKGLYAIHQRTEASLRGAIRSFRHAVRIEPTYASAFAGIALAFYQLSNLWLPPQEAMPRARAAALRALELDPNLAQARVLLGTVQAFYDRKWDEAERSFQRAIALNPGHALAYHHYGIFLTYQARFARARRMFFRARELDPLSTSIEVTALWPDLFGGGAVKIVAQVERLTRERPGFSSGHSMLAEIYEQLGRPRDALAAHRRALRAGGPPEIYTEMARLLAARGRKDEALAMLEKLRRTVRSGHVARFKLALARAHLGETGQAFQLLEKSFEARDEGLNMLAVDRRTLPLRTDPRFKTLLRRMGLSKAAARWESLRRER